MPRLVCAHAAHVRLQAALEWLSGALGSARGEAVIVASSQRAADDFVRLAQLPEGGLLGAHRTTLSHLAADITAGALAAAGRTRISRLGLEALAARAVAIVRARTPLEYFEPVAGTPGFARAVAATLEDLRLQRVEPEDLAAGGASGADLARLREAFDEELDRQGLADLAEVLTLAADTMPTARHHLLDRPLLLLDVTPRDRAEQALLAALVARSPDTFATLPARNRRGRAALEAALEGHAEVLDPQVESTDALDRVRRWVFSQDEPPAGPADDSLVFFSAPGEARESVEIARRIQSLARNQNVTFDQVAVFLRSPETYQPLLEDALQRADIPAFFTRGARRPDPSGRALLALLACGSEGLSASRFAEYLSLGQVPRLDDEGAPAPRPVPWVTPKDERQLVFASAVAPPAEPEPPDEVEGSRVIRGHLEVPLRWEQLLVDAAVIGGRDRWQRRLAGLAKELKRQVAALSAEAGARHDRKRRDLAALDNLQRFALPLVSFLDELPAEAKWQDWLHRIGELATLALRDPEPVLGLLAELRPMADVGPVGLDEVQVVLTQRLSFLREEPEGARFGKVFVGTLDEAAGRSFEVVFIPGLAEGVLPRKVFEDPLLLDEDRGRIRSDLPRRPRGLADERLRLHLGLGAARRTALLSYPRMDVAQGRPRVPSFYALDVLRAIEGRVPDVHALKKRAADAADARLGWPAPRRPEDAVDDTEYDLAVLGRLLGGSEEVPDGSGHYLVAAATHGAEPSIGVRALRAQAGRWRKPWGRADGLVASPDRPAEKLAAQIAARSLDRHRPSQRAYSPTALQTYAACPFRFYLQAILYLRPREVPAPLEALDPLTRGSLFHQIQFRLFQRLESLGWLPVTAERLNAAHAELDAVLRKEADEAREDLAPAIPAVWDREIERLRLDLRQWLREVVRLDTGWTWLRGELAFGLAPNAAERDRHSTAKPVTILDRFQVRGSVDLVECRTDGSSLRVTDHKTGRAPKDTPVYIGGGEHLQPLIYGLAVRALTDTPVETGRLYYCTRRGGFQSVEIPVDGAGEQRLSTVFETIEAAVTEGFLPAAPRKGACTYCDFRLACGPHEELRVSRKAPERLEALVALRKSK